ncbi:MFS transporter [uncultured Corynebacterium sp.]|uniref:MFS transporter n=1 Tax=uncultured Corynebacterium sp. TaxID=159447 RepID=UPI0025E280A4|nr:MFS transporter [uncultured Corynebacterium sp.]
MLKHEWIRVALGMYVVAFGANLFAPMVITYQRFTGLNSLQTTFLFGIYAAGLIVALFVGGPLSDTHGRRAIIRPALACTALGSAILLSGHTGTFPLLLLGRLTIGVAVGLAMSSGAAWMKELSPTVAVGAQRSSLALTLGFASAPLVSGLLAQFAPHPTVTPYVAHLALAAGIIPLTWGAPARPPEGRQRAWLPRSLLTKKFLPVTLYGPWVFGCASTAFGFLPIMLTQHTTMPIAVAGFIAMLTMGAGAVTQPFAVRFSATVGMAAAVAGMALAFVIVHNAEHPWALWLLPIDAIIMGFAYGTNMVNGLAETQHLAPAHELGAATGVFYTIIYLGFFAPFILSFLSPRVGNDTTFAFGIVAATITMLLTAYFHRAKRG